MTLNSLPVASLGNCVRYKLQAWYAGGMKIFFRNLKHLLTVDLKEDKESNSAYCDAFEDYVKQIDARVSALGAKFDKLVGDLSANITKHLHK